MDNDQITALAREYAEESAYEVGVKFDPQDWACTNCAIEAKNVIKFMLRRFCLVEKSKVEQLKQCFGSEEVYEVIDMLFPRNRKGGGGMNVAELRERQSWTLEQKIDHSLGTIETFVNRMGGEDKVYVSFSGGKDSTVLFHLARRIYPNILGVFCNTGNEYPDIVKFVRQTQSEGANIQIIRPKITPRAVWAQHGFPLVGKEQSFYINIVRKNPECRTAQLSMSKGTRFGISEKWKYLINEPYDVHNVCCNKLKKEPMHRFSKESGRFPIIGVMASESKRREADYIKNGNCNYFDTKEPKSQPLSIWLEDDIWAYIERFGLPIADIYHKGAMRTGCMGCGFGAQFADDTRFRVLYRNYPKCYDMVMNYTNNGVTFREALRKALAVNGLYLPDEQPPTLFDIIND